MESTDFATIEVNLGEDDIHNIYLLAERKLSLVLDDISMDMFREKEYTDYDALVKGIGEAYVNYIMYSTIKKYVESDEVQEALNDKKNEKDDK